MAFALGFGFSFMPSIAPFAALLFFTTHDWRFRASDALWGLAAVALCAPLLLSADWAAAGGLAFELVAAWVLFRTFERLSRLQPTILDTRTVGYGLVTGLALVVGLGWFQIGALNFDTAKTIAQAIVWDTHPALYGHAVLTLGALIAVLVRGSALRLASLALAATGVLASGSREAAIGWVVVATVLLVTGEARSWLRRSLEIALVLVMAGVSVGLGPALGWGRVGFGLEPADAAPTPNLLQGTEVASGDWWDLSWVTVESREAEIGGQALTVYDVTKRGDENWLRLQQIVPIASEQPYTVSAWIRADGAVAPGIQGWGQYRDANGETQTFVVGGVLHEGGWSTRVTGPGALIDEGIAERQGLWVRVFSTFRYTGEAATLPWYVGLAPTVEVGPGSAAFAGFQLEEGPVTAYVPGAATTGLDFGVARLPYWQAAWQGIRERPLLGRGEGAFAEYFAERWPGRNRLELVPAHPHNLALAVLFEQGVVGLAGLLLLLLVVAGAALVRRDLPMLAVVTALLIANAFDATLLHGGVFYPLVAVAGWRAGAMRSTAGASAAPTTLFSRLALAAADFAVAWIALVAAQFALGALSGDPPSSLPRTVLYALALWPAMAWREGLYPGYGLTAPQELKKQVAASAYATVILAAGALLFTRFLPVPPLALPLLGLVAAVVAPVARWLVKRALHAFGAWGRQVVILGAGDTGQRVARALQRTPLDGLHPVALFDDDAALRGSRVEGLRVYGSLADADAFAARHGVQHAIVAIPSLPQETLARLIDTKGRRFRYLQFVPRLAGLPAEDVVASNLDGMLAIEVRNGLHSRANRAFKRTIDLIGAAIGTLLLSPLLLAIWLWIRLDSRGPAFYPSPRVGQNGRVFRCLKFRTMYADAETRLEQLMLADPAIRAEYELWHKLEHDPRVTRAGRVLRRLSLDELPQLFNVLAGQMSLVGPRPYLTRELPAIGERADLILAAKPGITGYWQVTGRSEVTFGDRVAMEAHYVRNWSVWWDIIILARTPKAVLARRGAR